MSSRDDKLCEGGSVFSFTPEVPSSTGESYSCFAFDAELIDFSISGITWTPPSGSALLHHATLYATSESRPIGDSFDCDPMPEDAIALHTWVPGGSALELPEGVAMQLPRTTRTLIVEAHVYAESVETIRAASVTLCPSPSPPNIIAARLSLGAPIPAIRPHTVETSTSHCRLSSPFHIFSSWPHMHRVGKAFHGAVLHGDESLVLVDLPEWDFSHQVTYTASVDASAGDVIETTCTWQNDSDAYVLPGIYTENEMCSQGLIGWPREAAICDYE